MSAGSLSPSTRPWLVIVDPQVIFASPESAWGSPFFTEAVANIRRLAPRSVSAC